MPPPPTALSVALATSNVLLNREDLTGGRVIERYSNGLTMVSDPNVNPFDEGERRALLAELRTQTATGAGPVDLLAVNDRLQNLETAERRSPTPSTRGGTPCDEEEYERRKVAYLKIVERECREYIENEGCPPCYPPEMDAPFSFRDKRLDDFPAARCFVHPDGSGFSLPLEMQKKDWVAFRRHQDRIRARCHRGDDPEARFARYVESCRAGLLSFGLVDSAAQLSLSLDAKKQTDIENWMDFQVYHASLHDEFVAKDASNRSRAQKPESMSEELWQGHMAYDRNHVELHKGLMDWIEEQRVLMQTKTRGTCAKLSPAADAVHTAPKPKANNSRRSTRQASDLRARPLPSRQRLARDTVSTWSRIQGGGRVSKSKSKSKQKQSFKSKVKSTRIQEQVQQQLDSNLFAEQTTTTRRSTRISERTMPRTRMRENGKPLPPAQMNKVRKKKSPDRTGGKKQLQAAAKSTHGISSLTTVMTRSGRQVRLPAKYGFE